MTSSKPCIVRDLMRGRAKPDTATRAERLRLSFESCGAVELGVFASWLLSVGQVPKMGEPKLMVTHGQPSQHRLVLESATFPQSAPCTSGGVNRLSGLVVGGIVPCVALLPTGSCLTHIARSIHVPCVALLPTGSCAMLGSHSAVHTQGGAENFYTRSPYFAPRGGDDDDSSSDRFNTFSLKGERETEIDLDR